MKKTLSLLLLYLSIQVYSQNYTLTELDSITSSYKKKGEFEKAFKFNMAALQHYKKNNNSEGKAATYINIANTLSTFDEYQKSLHYLDEAKKELKKSNNKYLQAKIYGETGRNYAFLGLYKQSNVQLNKAIEYCNDLPSGNRTHYTLYFSYLWKWYNFEKLNNEDSIKAVRKTSLRLFPNEPLVYSRIAERFLFKKKHLDSAEYYLNKATALDVNNNDYINITAIILRGHGDLEFLKKDYKKALDYYQQAMPIYLKIDRDVDVMDIYKKIYDTYKALNNTEKANEYLIKYTALSENVRSGERKAVATVINKLAAEKEKESNQFFLIIFIIIVVAVIAVLIIREINKKNVHKQNKILEESLLETDKLKKKAEISINDLSRMATSNDPFFISRFIDFYPEFYEKVTQEYPDLTKHDIRFLAYLKLNFTNKEIGQFANVTVRAVETKKYRLKKKLNLSAETDLSNWVLEL